LKSPSEEYNKILDVVTRYSIHRSGISFTCKKHGESAADLHTVVGATTLDNLRTIYSPTLARELLPVSLIDEDLNFEMSGYVSNANYNVKKSIFILFINNRLVESQNIKKAMDDVYAPFLPKGSHPFLYMALKIQPQNIDVNVHPTKKEVRFLHEEQIIAAMQVTVEAALAGSNASRTFLTQTLLPQSQAVIDASQDKEPPSQAPGAAPVRKPDHKLVRTNDPNPVGQLDTYFISKKRGRDDSKTDGSASQSIEPPSQSQKRAYGDEQPQVELTSVQTLWTSLNKGCHQALKTLFRDAVFVGCADEGFFLAQSGTKLYLMNSHALSKQLIYQEVIRQFSAFSLIELVEPISVHAILTAALELPAACWEASVGSKTQIVTDATELLTSRSEMLDEYFGLKIDDQGRLCALPSVIDGYIPNLDGLPIFLLRLATEVNWNEEEACFHGVATELADFCSIQPALVHSKISTASPEHTKTMQHQFFPLLKKKLLPPHEFASDSTLVQVACLEKLYQIFERC